MTSELQRDIDAVQKLVDAEALLPAKQAWQRIRARLTPDRDAAERQAADIEAIQFARRAAGLLHGFMLDTNAIGAREAGVNLARSIKEALKADAAIDAMGAGNE